MDWLGLAELFLFFILCSFLGWVIEEAWVSYHQKKFVNRGFLIGPICPIYGLAAALGIWLLTPLLANPLLVFVVGFFAFSALEYLTSFLLEKMFGARWWDYSYRRFNLRGRVCLFNSVVFGVGGLIIVYLLWPAAQFIFTLLPATLITIIAIVFAVVLLADLITSIVIIKGFKKISRSPTPDDTEDITAYVRQVLSERGRLYRRLNAFDFIINRPMTLYYRDFNEDFIESPNQNYRLPENYQWIRRRKASFGYLIGSIWAHLHCFFHGIKYENLDIIKAHSEQNFFIYANHTQALSDILAPVDYLSPRRVRFLAAPANLAVPVIGPLLPDLGMLPVPDSIHGLAKLEKAIRHYYSAGNPIIIYPEAHVWPYYTEIRPLPNAAFAYPVRLSAPVITATTIYKKRRGHRKPRMIIHFDGPFYPDTNLSRQAATAKLHDEVEAAMQKAATKSNYKYIKYRKSRKK